MLMEQAHAFVDQIAKLIELVGVAIIVLGLTLSTFASVELLAGIVVIRTVLSFSLETEIEGVWPWRRADQASHGSDTSAER